MKKGFNENLIYLHFLNLIPDRQLKIAKSPIKNSKPEYRELILKLHSNPNSLKAKPNLIKVLAYLDKKVRELMHKHAKEKIIQGFVDNGWPGSLVEFVVLYYEVENKALSNIQRKKPLLIVKRDLLKEGYPEEIVNNVIERFKGDVRPLSKVKQNAMLWILESLNGGLSKNEIDDYIAKNNLPRDLLKQLIQLDNFIKSKLRAGKTKVQIRNYLVKGRWDKDLVNKILKYY
jgi:hypothetical protein